MQRKKIPLQDAKKNNSPMCMMYKKTASTIQTGERKNCSEMLNKSLHLRFKFPAFEGEPPQTTSVFHTGLPSYQYRKHMEGKKFSLTLLRREKGEKFSPLVEQTTSEQNAPHNYGLEKKNPHQKWAEKKLCGILTS